MKEKYKTKKMKMNNLIGVSGAIKAGKDLVGEMLQYISDVENPNYDDFQHHVNLEPKYEIKKCADKLKDCVCVILGCTREQLEDREFKEKELGEEWWVYERSYSVASFHNKRDILSKDEHDSNSEDGLYWGWKWDLLKLTPRLILQLLGTQGGRMIIHPNIWVNALFADYKQTFKNVGQNFMETTSSFPNWIITDIRFPENEGKAVSSRGGLMIGVKRKFGLRFPEYAFRELSHHPYAIPSMLMNDDEVLYDTLNHESETSMGDHSWCDIIIENNGTMEELFDKVLEAVHKKELV